MTAPQIDYQTVFQEVPCPIMLLTPELVIADVNFAYLQLADRKREELLGRKVFDAFPDDPAESGATGTSNVGASMNRVLATGERDNMPLQRYDVEPAEGTGAFEERYWCPVNAPVFGPDGRVVLIAHWVEEVSGLIRQFVAAQAASA